MARNNVTVATLALLGSLVGLIPQARAQTQVGSIVPDKGVGIQPLPPVPTVTIGQGQVEVEAQGAITVNWAVQTDARVVIQDFKVVLKFTKANGITEVTTLAQSAPSSARSVFFGPFSTFPSINFIATVGASFRLTGAGGVIAEKSFDLGGLNPQQINPVAPPETRSGSPNPPQQPGPPTPSGQ